MCGCQDYQWLTTHQNCPTPKKLQLSSLTWIENVISFYRVVIVENWTLPRILILRSLFSTNNSISSLHSTIWEKIVKLGCRPCPGQLIKFLTQIQKVWHGANPIIATYQLPNWLYQLPIIHILPVANYKLLTTNDKITSQYHLNSQVSLTP